MAQSREERNRKARERRAAKRTTLTAQKAEESAQLERQREHHGWSFRNYTPEQSTAIRHYIVTGEKVDGYPTLAARRAAKKAQAAETTQVESEETVADLCKRAHEADQQKTLDDHWRASENDNAVQGALLADKGWDAYGRYVEETEPSIGRSTNTGTINAQEERTWNEWVTEEREVELTKGDFKGKRGIVTEVVVVNRWAYAVVEIPVKGQMRKVRTQSLQ